MGSPRTRRACQMSIVVLAAVGVLVPAGAVAAPDGTANANLSPRLTELSKPAVSSAPRGEQAAQLSLAVSGPGSLLRDGNRILVDVRFDRGAAAGVGALRSAGAEIVTVSRRYQTVTVAAKPADLPEIGGVARVGGVTEVLTPIVRGADCGGSVRSEGDTQLIAPSARVNWGVDGSGVTVGILSDSFDRDTTAVTHAAGDVASGDLPGTGSPCGSTSPVGILDDSEAAGADEGRAMAQIVHDLAPGAAIDFATAFTGEFAFAANIKALAAAGAKVIADDVGYFEEPFFQDGPVAQAINEVTAGGVSYFSAAGNDNLVNAGGNDIASWEAPTFRDGGLCPAALVAIAELKAEHCMDFDPGVGVDNTFGITVSKGATLTVDLQWAEPWGGVATDLDAYLLDSGGEVLEAEESLVGSASDNINGSQRPAEIFQWENKTGSSQNVQLAINRFAGGSPQLKFALLQNGSGVTQTEYPESSGGDTVGPTIFGHSGAQSAVSVGAVRFDGSTEPERYSSRGPVIHRFGPVTAASPAASIGEQVISKPDIVATDCGATTFFASFVNSEAVWRFCGTSAAAPHAAAVAALVRQANPGASAAQVRGVLTSTARPVGAFGADAVGAGLIDANAAVNALALPPAITITKAPQPLSRNRRPTIEFTANRPVAFACSVDGAAPQPCASPYTVPANLSDGPHRFAVSGTDLGGRVGSSGVVSFTVDTRAPRTFIAKHPRKLVRTGHRRARVFFRFRSSEAGSTFLCKVDRGLPRFCRRRFVIRVTAGRHTVRVRARDQAGNVDATPALFRFRVKRVG